MIPNNAPNHKQRLLSRGMLPLLNSLLLLLYFWCFFFLPSLIIPYLFIFFYFFNLHSWLTYSLFPPNSQSLITWEMCTARKLSGSLHQASGRYNGPLLLPFFSCCLSLNPHNPAFAPSFLWCSLLECCLWSYFLTPVSPTTPYICRWAQAILDFDRFYHGLSFFLFRKLI